MTGPSGPSGPSEPQGTGVEDDHRAPLLRTLGLTRPAARRLGLSTVLGAGTVAAGIGLIGTSAWLISTASERPPESALALAIVAVQFFGLSRGFFRYGERMVGHDAAFRMLAGLRVHVYRRLEALAPAGLPAFRSGDLLARLVQDVDSLQDLVIRVVPPFAIAVVVGAATVAVVWWMLPAAGLVLLVCLLLAATVVPWLTGTLARRNEARQSHVRGELTASLVDLIDGAPDLVVFGAARAQVDRITGFDAELTGVARSAAGTAGVGLGLTTLLSGLAMWGSLCVGIPAVHTGHLDHAYLAVIVLIPLAAFELVVGLPVATQALQAARRAAARVFAVTDARPPVEEPLHPAACPLPPVAFSGRAIGTRYPAADHPALAGVDVDLRPGQRIAVVGPSGAGKSALAAVMLRFLPYSGSATLAEVELDHLAGDDVRQLVGLVAQDGHLFDTTVAENLRIGRRDATDDELLDVLGRVGLADWVDGLPNGILTEVGTRGNRLSGGQRQRISVARALLADFSALVLDEPTEHLDPVAADALGADLLGLTSGRSTVLITHRLAGLEAVDEVLVLDAGRVVERGTHDQLLAAGGRYADLWRQELHPVEPGSRTRYSRHDRLVTASPPPPTADKGDTP